MDTYGAYQEEKNGLSKGQKDKIRSTLDSILRYQQLHVAANQKRPHVLCEFDDQKCQIILAMDKKYQGSKKIQEIVNRGQVANSDTEKADIFNNFLCSMFTREDTSALADLKAQFLYSLHSITIVSISADDVFRELYRIDHTKSSGPDPIPGHLLKEGAPFIGESLADLFS